MRPRLQNPHKNSVHISILSAFYSSGSKLDNFVQLFRRETAVVHILYCTTKAAGVHICTLHV